MNSLILRELLLSKGHDIYLPRQDQTLWQVQTNQDQASKGELEIPMETTCKPWSFHWKFQEKKDEKKDKRLGLHMTGTLSSRGKLDLADKGRAAEDGRFDGSASGLPRAQHFTWLKPERT